MRYSLILAFSLVLLSGCFTGRKALDNMLGKSYSDMVNRYGPERMSYSDGKTGRIYIYCKRRYSVSYYGTVDKWLYTMFYIDRHDQIYNWRYEEESIAPETIDVRVLFY